MKRNLPPQAYKVFEILRNILVTELLIRVVWILAAWYRGDARHYVPSTPAELLLLVNTSAAYPLRSMQINPAANVFNRPTHSVENRPDYLGPRPDVDTEADIQLIVETCRGSYVQNEKIRDIASCMKLLAEGESSYYSLPDITLRASAQNPQHAEYDNADGNHNTMQQYPEYQAPTSTSRGACHGPVIPYHTYWSGSVTWRVEAFIKSYLFTQNIPCSQLWLWFDADSNPNAVRDTLSHPIFARFLPLVERGDLRVEPWKFPSWVPLPPDEHPFDLPGVDIDPKLMPFEPAALSDAVRFIMLHMHGGVYLDIDMLLLRDLRPLLLPKNHTWAERWGTAVAPGDYNTAVMSLSPQSRLSTYFLLGAVRMGSMFHPRVVGKMALTDGRDKEFLKLNDAAFDPVWTIFEGYEGQCTVPCLTWIDDAFRAQKFDAEWSAFEGAPLKTLDLSRPQNVKTKLDSVQEGSSLAILASILADRSSSVSDLKTALRNVGIVANYDATRDRFAPSNRTMQNFYRGSYAYHIHNQWAKQPEPSSWLDVLQQAHNEFFAGTSTNPYGEQWEGPEVLAYDFYPQLISGG
ncbi:hypothetical protein EJ05DRAFT_494895 [Pseudovirgaria hyperparasitica]|uniref:SnoRNA binding protein-like protein n=1 Tax=Pseudovirgaria hyperparasitica TaxID=470096 RepID=A0A6A6VUF5_9PEZI|nr:uncharacterized protein EJ05DRAFT_494895 [Pseudovirgaria hyperparasitica]KAF2753416.1 hypothetical protein EJ05DRAFT_494895 [Pseudovirgaria hyperparasitica]